MELDDRIKSPLIELFDPIPDEQHPSLHGPQTVRDTSKFRCLTVKLPNYTADKLIRNRRLDNRLEVHRWIKRKSIGSTISKIYHVTNKDLFKAKE